MRETGVVGAASISGLVYLLLQLHKEAAVPKIYRKCRISSAVLSYARLSLIGRLLVSLLQKYFVKLAIERRHKMLKKTKQKNNLPPFLLF